MKHLLKRAFLAVLAGCLLLQPLAGATAAAAADEAHCQSAQQHDCLCGETCTLPALTVSHCTSFIPMPAQRLPALPALFAEYSARPGLPPPLASRG